MALQNGLDIGDAIVVFAHGQNSQKLDCVWEHLDEVLVGVSRDGLAHGLVERKHALFLDGILAVDPKRPSNGPAVSLHACFYFGYLSESI